MSLREEAEKFFSASFDEARDWYASAEFVRIHSLNVAKCAEAIVKQMQKNGHDELDPDMAYVCGLLHDIGKTGRDWVGLDHPVVGYEILSEKGWEVPARISMTHTYYGYESLDWSDFWERFANKKRLKFTKKFMEEVEIDDYDRLIQLLDNMANHSGVMSISDRFSDILIRHELKNGGQHLKILYRLKVYFDKKCGMNIYELFKSDIIRLAMEEPNRDYGWEEELL